MKTICIVDDDKDITAAIKTYCELAGYQTLVAYDGQMAIDLISKNPIDLLIIDQMMPIMNGTQTIEKLRQTYHFPIIILSAKSEDADKISGLNIGADDYITKPFVPMELMARIKAQLRRAYQFSMQTSDNILQIAHIKLDLKSKEVWIEDELVKLTPIEFEILAFLMKNPNQVFSSNQIYEKIWNEDAYDSSGTVSVHIRHLREKIELDPNHPQHLQVVWGMGYKLIP